MPWHPMPHGTRWYPPPTKQFRYVLLDRAGKRLTPIRRVDAFDHSNALSRIAMKLERVDFAEIQIWSLK